MSKRQNFWTRETADGEIEFRSVTKALFSVLLIGMAFALYFFLSMLGRTEEGLEIIVVLAYGVGVLMIVATFLVIIISLIEYLRSLEESSGK